jgi:hypothetical protein
MYSSSTEVEYATDITLGRIVRFKKLSLIIVQYGRYRLVVVFALTFTFTWFSL